MTAVDAMLPGFFLKGFRRTPPAVSCTVEDFHWGYAIRNVGQAPILMVLAQTVCWIAAIPLLVLSIGLWIMPGGAVPLLDGFRIGVTVVLASISASLFWFASRGLESEIQVDLKRGEVREVARNRAGRTSLFARHGFDTIGGVFIDRHSLREALPRGHGMLVIRLGNTAQVLPVASGEVERLEPLRDRLGRDLVVRPRRVTPAAPVPRRMHAAGTRHA